MQKHRNIRHIRTIKVYVHLTKKKQTNGFRLFIVLASHKVLHAEILEK